MSAALTPSSSRGFRDPLRTQAACRRLCGLPRAQSFQTLVLPQRAETKVLGRQITRKPPIPRQDFWREKGDLSEEEEKAAQEKDRGRQFN